jgi:hypothetical protein
LTAHHIYAKLLEHEEKEREIQIMDRETNDALTRMISIDQARNRENDILREAVRIIVQRNARPAILDANTNLAETFKLRPNREAPGVYATLTLTVEQR